MGGGCFHLLALRQDTRPALLSRLSHTAEIPLHDDDEFSSVPGDRDPSKCVFGTEEYSIGATWHPTLEIFNRPTYMPCVLCTCYQAEMFGYYFYESDLLPKVKCEQIGGQCPLLDCEYPISDPRKCCKYCPDDAEKEKEKASIESETPDQKDMLKDGNDHEGKVKIDHHEVENKFIELEENFNYFAGILSGNNFWPRRQTGAVSRIYLEFEPESQAVHITIAFKHLSGKPTFLEVTDPNDPDQPLFAHKIDHVTDLAPGNKICITWENVEFKTVEKLSSQALFATIKTEIYPEGEVKGLILKHRALLRESFGAVLSPISDPGMSAGGQLFASLHHGSKTSLDIVVALQGLSDFFLHEVPVEVRLYDSSSYLIGQFAHTVNPTASQIWNEQSVTWEISDETQLVRGLITVKVMVGEKGAQPISFVGTIEPKNTCSSFHCVLSQGTQSHKTPKGYSGSTQIAFESNFDINYQIHTSVIFSDVTQVAFVSGINKESEFELKLDVSYTYFDQWAVGLISAPSAELIQSLMIGELYLQISTTKDSSALYGKLVPLAYSKHFSNKNIPPLIMSGRAMIHDVATRAAGNVRVNLDDQCRFQFEVFTSGFEKSARLSLEIGQLLSEKLTKSVWSDRFSTGSISGSINQPSKEFLEYLNVGQIYIQVGSKNYPEGEIRTKVSIANSCEPSSVQNRNQLSSKMMSDGQQTGESSVSTNSAVDQVDRSRQESLAKEPNSCFFEGKFHANFETWTPEFDRTCTVCHCSNRAVICEGKHQCEVPTCENPVIPDGECCFKCPTQNEISKSNVGTESDSCHHSGIDYAIGEIWNPIVHPFGVIKCAECTCRGKNDVFCNRIECPKTDCSHPIKKNPTDCCSVCVEDEEKIESGKRIESSVDLENSMQADSGFVATRERSDRSCQLGDFLYSSGEKFHPVVPPFGKQLCVDCLCTDGKTTCSRVTCDPVDNCPEQFIRTMPDECCPKCMSLKLEGDKTSYADFQLGS
ncbi:chordin-like isoform X2 [Convolutriloba macropyga]|uniref:chordin-like isoform X2 n=1 Tax=Convolutriloba macropyga TaxID=536237 RepID=UPI003F521C98